MRDQKRAANRDLRIHLKIFNKIISDYCPFDK